MPSGSYNEFTALAGAIGGTGEIGETITQVIVTETEQILTSLTDSGGLIDTTTVALENIMVWVDDTVNDPTGTRGWRLVAGNTATNLPYTLRPADYNASTNAKFWQREI